MNTAIRILLLSVSGFLTQCSTALAAPGDVDSSFVSQAPFPTNSNVSAIAIQPDGKVLIGTSSIIDDAIPRVARLNADGSLDSTFVPVVLGRASRAEGNIPVSSIALQPDGKVLIGGRFIAVNGVPRRHVARLECDGSLDTAFDAVIPQIGSESGIHCVLVQPDEKVLVAGLFNNASQDMARYNADGTPDSSFAPNQVAPFAGVPIEMALQRDGKIVVVGSFTSVYGVPRAGVVRLHSDGTLDSTFVDARVGGINVPSVQSLALQPDGKVLIGGPFTLVDGVSRRGIARLHTNGTRDDSFNPGMGINIPESQDGLSTRRVGSIALQQDGKVLIGGWFESVNGVERFDLARLHSDGSVDLAFKHEFARADRDFRTARLALLPDDKVLVGGTSFGNQIVRLHAAEALPPLRIVRSGAGPVLSWPATGSEGAVLEAAESLTGATIWTRESSEPILIGGEFVLPLHADVPAKFYRLRKE